jgi:hypothetical protein
MSENIFSAVLTLSLLAGGTVAFGSEFLASRTPAPQVAATLPTVTVTGKRVAAADTVTLPTVTVTGRRATPTEVASETSTVEQRVQ